MLKLNLGCGSTRIEGFVGVDQAPGPSVDIVWNLDKFPWPFEDNSVNEIIANQIIEHVADLVAFMEELHRVMRPGATGTLTAPWWSHINTHRDPTHRRGIADQTLFFFNAGWRKKNGKEQYGIKADFAVGFSLEFDPLIEQSFPGFFQMPDGQRQFILTHFVNVVFNCIFKIEKVAP
jgi:SAM-dependent methyltransferase